MSVTASEVDHTHDSPVHPGEEHHHGPSDNFYIGVFAILVALTALEVSTYWWVDWFGESARHVATPLLLILMVIKFLMVAGFFMHLRFDSALLRRIFTFGLLTAVIVYTIALTVMGIWTYSGNLRFNDPPPPVTPTTVPTTGAGSGG